MNPKDTAQGAEVGRQLGELAVATARTKGSFLRLARGLVRQSRGATMHAFVDELHRRFVYAPDPMAEFLRIPWDRGMLIDADEACLFVAVLAKAVDIPCRFVLARYREHAWTVFLAYEDEEGRWIGIDPLRQKTKQRLEELVFGSDLEEVKPILGDG
jgi:hypothetical protein